MQPAEQLALNLMEDVWASLHLSPNVVLTHRPDLSKNSIGLEVELVDPKEPAIVYFVDNGRGNLPDGESLVCRYGRSEPVEVFRVHDLPLDPVSWQSKAVEPLITALKAHAGVRECA